MTTSTITKCPEWCTLEPGHDWDGEHPGSVLSRGHGGPKFGDYVSTEATEWSDAPGRLLYVATVVSDGSEDLDQTGLIGLARAAVEAAAWLREQGVES